LWPYVGGDINDLVADILGQVGLGRSDVNHFGILHKGLDEVLDVCGHGRREEEGLAIGLGHGKHVFDLVQKVGLQHLIGFVED